MANFIMKNWQVVDKLPYVSLGSAGDNSASIISIVVDEIIDNGNYYLDITDVNNNTSNTQKFEKVEIKRNMLTNGNETYILSLIPLTSFLGNEGVKKLQVRCVDGDTVKQSNVFHAKVTQGSDFNTKYDVALFEQYLQIIKDMVASNTNNNSGNSDDNGGGNTPTPTPTPTETIESVYIDMKDMPSGKLSIRTNRIYHIIDTTKTKGGVKKLEIKFSGVPQDGEEYRFNFISGNPATELILPNSVLVPSTLSMSANTYYDVTINPYTQVMTYTSQGLN